MAKDASSEHFSQTISARDAIAEINVRSLFYEIFPVFLPQAKCFKTGVIFYCALGESQTLSLFIDVFTEKNNGSDGTFNGLLQPTRK